MQPMLGAGGIVGQPQSSLLEEFRKELSKAFGTEAQLETRGNGVYVIIPLDEAKIREIIISRMSPEYASATDVKIEGNAVKVILRVL